MRRLIAFFLISCICAMSAAQAIRISFTPYADAKPILDALSEILPAELKAAPPSDEEKNWNTWVRKRDAEIRARLAQGDADSVVNFLMFGTSFTTAPRFTTGQLRASSEGAASSKDSDAANWQGLFERRVQDLIQGMAAPGTNERLQFARQTLEKSGISFSEKGTSQKASAYLLENVKRVLREQSQFQQTLETARGLNNPTEEFAERSKLFKDRGLSLDTSLPPDFALEVALREIKKRGMLKPDSVLRVGIIGPGLDFTDKQEGFDFYPTQTVQPFAVLDSLIRLGLAKPEEIEVDILDLSPRVLSHLKHAAQAASAGHGYVVQLPRDESRHWSSELVDYWNHFGDQIGSAVPPAAIPSALKGVRLRATRVRWQFVQRMKAFDIDAILQRATPDESHKFDLLVATNILVYYDTFEQALAMTNISSMLRPGGFLLTNTLLLELPASRLRSVDYVSVQYSDRTADGDQIVWYRRTP